MTQDQEPQGTGNPVTPLLKQERAELRQRLHLKQHSPDIRIMLDVITMFKAAADRSMRKEREIVDVARAQGAWDTLDTLETWINDESAVSRGTT